MLLVSEIFTQVLGFGGSSRRNAGAAPRRSLAYRVWLVCFWAANACALALLLSGQFGWAAVAFFAPAPWLAWQIVAPSSRGLGAVSTHFSTAQKEVWLTIDDGPDPATTPQVLALLDQYRARATFFLIGQKVAQHPALATEILRRGHTVANHTHSHSSFRIWCASTASLASEIGGCANALTSAGAVSLPYFRPPVGLKSIALHRMLALRGDRLVLWSARGFDTLTRDPARCARRILRDVKPGAILLLHESGSNATRQLAVLAAVLTGLREESYACVIPEPASLR